MAPVRARATARCRLGRRGALLTVLLVLYAVIGFAVLAAGRRLGRRALVIGAVAPVATLVWLLAHLGGVLDGQPVLEHRPWVAELGLAVDLRLDGFGALMVAIISGIGLLVLAYTAGFLSRDDEGTGRLAGLLTLFAGAMVGLVLADHLLVLYTCWELTSVASYLLIAHHHEHARARAAALQALLVTGAGGLAMLVGFVLIGQSAGTYRLGALLAAPPSGTVVTVGLVLVIVGAATKSAQYPFHSWLPGAMVAPTPVSAYLHSATMVTAGVYLVARFSPAFADVDLWRPLVLTIGIVTMVVGALRALRQHDLKLLLAYGTVSQLGFMFVLLGAGTAAAATAGCELLLAHAVFKAALFMVVGIIDHETGTRDLRALRGLGRDRAWRPVVVVAVVSAASMAGVPLALGFVAKEAAFEAFEHHPFDGAAFALVGIVAGSALTVAYTIRFVWGAFTDGGTDWVGAPAPAATDHAPSVAFVAPAGLLAVVTLVLGVAPGLADRLVGAAAEALVPGSSPPHLALWHGFNLALGLSGLALATGVVLFVGRRRVARVLATGHRVPTGADVYRAALRGLNVGADRVTGVVQSGSLPVYIGVILLTVTVLPGIALARSHAWAGWPDVLDTPAHIPIVILMAGGAIGAAVARRRLAAVLLLSLVGYGMAGLFVVEGAPDLALTQVTVETLSTVMFVLVLRRLPDRFGSVHPRGRPLRLVVAGAVGAFVFAFALVASQHRTGPSVSDEMVARSVPDGGGKNVVNVILVDFRGFDTLGEITVLTVAAVGAVALARSGRRRRPSGAAAGTAAAPATTVEEGAA
jgi:multicomponent Na+:H+ antiporter subunit A